MTITAPELVLLGKCLAMTTSPIDGEALAGIRRANAILARHKLTWPEFLALRFPTREGFVAAGGIDADTLEMLMRAMGGVPYPGAGRRSGR